MGNVIRVLVVDDSPLARAALKDILSSDEAIEVVGEASDGNEGVRKTLALKPDVITMDLKMPMMNGLDAIERIMEEMPTPIIVVSSMDVKVIITALGIGAMDFVAITDEIGKIASDLIEKVKLASRIKPLRRIHVKPYVPNSRGKSQDVSKVIAIGSSTGGPQALQIVLSKLPPHFPGKIIVVQHMSPGFTVGLAEWLKFSCPFDIRVARQGDILMRGEVLLAPDDYILTISGDSRITLREDASHSLLHVPSIDKMMQSVAESFGADSVGVLMTGMGKDGADGMRSISVAGGMTIAQDEKSSVVFGMNRAAIETGCVKKIVPLDEISSEILAAM